MRKHLKLASILIACVALLGLGASIAAACHGGHTGGSASETEYTPKPGDQGCTPGYWKNHTGSWVSYSTSDLYDTVFGVNFKPGLTLLEALKLGGGGFNALARHAASALLNSSNSNINYGLTTSQIIALVQKAFATDKPEQIKDELAAFNETRCSIDAHGNPIG